MDLFTDLANILKKQLTNQGTPFPVGASVEDLLRLMLNYEAQTVRPVPRQVHVSSKFNADLASLSQDEQQAAKDIQAKFVKGDDINGHLSRASANANETDRLLADWGIHHLHVSTHKTNPTDTFYARTGPVMFVRISPTDAHFIDIYPHGQAHPEAFSRQAVLAIMDKEWPRLLDPFRLKGIDSLAHQPSDLEIKALRGDARRGTGSVNAILKIGNSYIAPPGGGLMTDGTPSANVIRADETMYAVKALENQVTANLAQTKAFLSTQNGIPESELHFELVPLANPSGWGVREVKTGTIVAQTQ